MNLVDIANGTVKNIFNLNQDISNRRMQICYTCPLFLKKLGGVCNSRLWLNPNNGDVSTIKKEGYLKGCGCLLKSKTRLPEAKCPVNKW